MVTIKLELPEDIEAQARAAGLLTREKIEALIEAELDRQRQQAWSGLFGAMAAVRDAGGDALAALSDAEFDALVREAIAATDPPSLPPQP